MIKLLAVLISTLSLFGTTWQTNYFYTIKATPYCFIPENLPIERQAMTPGSVTTTCPFVCHYYLFSTRLLPQFFF